MDLVNRLEYYILKYATQKLLTIRVTEEQDQALRQFFIHFDWDLDIVEEQYEPEVVTNREQEVPYIAPVSVAATGSTDVGSDDNDNDSNDSGAPGPSGNNDNNECPHCYSTPCVTSVTQSWFGKQQRPRAGNNLIRKKKYKLFWKMIDDRGLRKNGRYQRKK